MSWSLSITTPSNDGQLVSLNSKLYSDDTITGILQPSNALTENGDIAFCVAWVTLITGQITIHLNNFTDHAYTLKRGSHVANFSDMIPGQMKCVEPIDSVTPWHLLQDNPKYAAFYVSSMIKSSKPEDSKRTKGFPTPEDSGTLSNTILSNNNVS